MIIVEYTHAEQRVVILIFNVSVLKVERVMSHRNVIYLIRVDIIQKRFQY